MKKLLCYILLISLCAFAAKDSLMDVVKGANIDGFNTHGLDENGKVIWKLSGENAEMRGSIITVQELQAFFLVDETRSFELISPGCRFLQSLKEVKSASPVRIVSEGLSVEGIGYDVYLDKKIIHVRSSVHGKLKGNPLKIDKAKDNE